MPRGRPRKNPVTVPDVNQPKRKRGRPRKSESTASTVTLSSLKPQADYIFSLDIGTRTVIGVLSEVIDETFKILDYVVVPHTKRAMKDGQIEDIDEVARIVAKAKSLLEQKTGIKLTKVAIAAAGRALKTQHVKIDIDIDGKDSITEEMVKSFELEAISEAQSALDKEQKDNTLSFFCVGHSVVNFYLDDYPINSIVGHKGKVATVDIIAAFLPSVVVESLYAVMDKNDLEVTNLTLEPIAAMNVIIPPEIRLINVALVDIGAGTSDIAIAKSGSIVAYAMATTAGDEITEEIIKAFLVDFDTAEEMKQSASSENITYKDILGLEHTITNTDFFKTLYPAVETLADTISKSIIDANGGDAPSAVFLVGGGSQVSELGKLTSKKLGIPATRVAIGGIKGVKGLDLSHTDINGPEFVTPVGIGLTSVREKGYDFSTVKLNGKKVRVFNTNKITIMDLLTIAGYKSANIIGRTGRGLSFTLNGEEKLFKGEPATPAVITVNDIPANISTPIHQGDNIRIIPAVNGNSVNLRITDICPDFQRGNVILNGADYPFGNMVSVNGQGVMENYEIQNFDNILVTSVEKLSDLLSQIGIEKESCEFYVGKRKINSDYTLKDGESFTIEEKKAEIKPDEQNESAEPQVAKADKPEVPKAPETTEKPVEKGVTIRLNGKVITLDKPQNDSPNIFLELMAIADIDTNNPQGTDIELSVNGKTANFMDVLHDGDECIVRWIK